MFGSNAFGALAVESDSAAAGPSRVSVEGPEVDADWVKLVRTNHDAVVRVSDKVDLSGLPYECSLMAVSNNWDLLLVGSNTGLQVYRLSDLHRLLEGAAKDASPAASPVQTIPLPARPIWVKLAMNDERLVVSMADGAGTSLWRVRDVLAGSTTPYHTFTSNVPSHLTDVLPNPSVVEPFSRYVTLLGKQGFVIADIEANTLSTSLAEQATCASWSAKGKQIAVGTPSGAIIQYTPEGSAKATIPPPPDLDTFAPTSVQWLENDLFLVSYAHPNSPPDEPLEVYTIHRRGTEFTYTKFFDPLNTMGVAGRSGLFRFYVGLKAWGERTKHLIALASGLASEVALMHGSMAPEGNGPSWEVLVLEETARGVLPAAKPGQSDDTSVIGLALDLTSDRSIKRGIVSGIEQPDLAPAPRLLVLSQDGVIISFDVQYPDAGPYPGMIRPQDISSAPQMEVSMEDTTTGPTPVPAFGGFGQSNATTTPSKPPATGFSGFGQTATPAFGSPSTPSAFGGSTFGSSTTPTSSIPKPAFGSSAFGQTSTPLAFGQSTFGKSSTPIASPAPPTAFGQSAFGQPTKPAQAGPSAFAASTSSPSAFGASTSTSLGFGAFGSAKPASGTAPTFGTSTFGSTAPSSAVNQTSAFGSSNSKGAFGSGSVFGTGAFGAPSSSETTNSAFSGFGSGTPSTPSGFSSFGAKATEPTKAVFTGFGQAAKSTSPSPAPDNDFGLGGFASALEPSAKLSNNGQGDSPPDSPVFGAAKQLNVPDDDDSPPGTPVPATTPASKPHTSSSSVSSSFIKRATAFSGMVSGGFGAFGQTSTSQSRSTTGTPPAFASPAPTTPSAFGSTAFGTPSTGGATGFGQSSKPVGFGTGFGQSSKPVGFGTPSAPAAPSTFGNISGGFGGFAAKPSAPSSQKATSSGFGGFGGFASKSTATSVFGGAENASPANEKSIFETAENIAAKPRTTPAFSATKPTAQADKVPITTIKQQTVPPAVVAEEATLPAGYDVTSTDAKSSTPETIVKEIKPEPAPAPPGYDVPAPPSPPADTPAPSSGVAVPVEATIVPIPEEPVVEEPESDQDGKNVDGAAEEADWEEVDDDEEQEEDVVEPEEEEEGFDEEEDQEEEEEYDDEEGEDEEEEDEEQEDGPIRRRSSSIMSPIKEESSEELESEDAAGEYDEEAESEEERENEERESTSPLEPSKTPKSPPAWFAKPPQAASTPSEPSLLSRLGPAPTPAPPSSQPIAAGHSIPTNFINKHAVRASSPLGQPPETAQNSTTPPVSPAPPTSNETSGFSLFPPKQKELAQKDPAEPSTAFSLFGQKSNDTESTISVAASTPTFSLFGQKTEPAASPATNSGGFSLFPPRPLAAPAPNSLFGAQPAASPTPLFGSKPSSSAEPAKPTFGLGLGKPPAPAKPPADLASSSASQSRGPSVASTSSVQSPKPSIPLGQPKGKPQPVPTTFTVPARQPPPAIQRPSAPATKTIAATLEQMIQTVQAELMRLKATLEVNAKYHQSVAIPGFAKIDSTNVSKHKALPLSTISDLLVLVEGVFSDLDQVRQSDSEVETKMAELQSRMLKNDMKIGQIEKFIEAREDPSFVQAMQVNELSSEQIEMQVQLQHAMQATESQFEELETALAVFKRDTSSESSQKANVDPVVERVERSVRAVDTALQGRLQTIDELSRRIDAIRVSTPTKTRPISTGHLGTPSRKPPPSVSFSPSPEVLREIHLQVSVEGSKPAWLAGMKVARLSRPGSNEKKASIPASLASGPVKMNSLPLAGQLPKGVQASVKAELCPNEPQDGPEAEEKPTIPPSTPEETKAKSLPPSSTPAAETPSFGFGGIKISLDPGQVVTSAASRISRPGGGSHRAHVPAAQLRSTSGSGAPSPPTTGFTFNLPAESPKETKKGTPSGFFSLSGFDQK